MHRLPIPANFDVYSESEHYCKSELRYNLCLKVNFAHNLENVSWVSCLRDVTTLIINRTIVFERKMPFLAFKFKPELLHMQPEFKKGWFLMVLGY